MAGFEDYVREEREKLTEQRKELMRQRDDLDRQLQEIEREFAAVEAYEKVKSGKATDSSAPGSKRRTGIRQSVMEAVRRHPDGISRADLVEELGVKGDKSGEQSISNALSNLKKQGKVGLDQGRYTAVADG